MEYGYKLFFTNFHIILVNPLYHWAV